MKYPGRPVTELRICSVVGSIEETANRFNIPKAFIGLILLPLVVSKSSVTHGTKLDTLRRLMQLNMSLPCGWL
jgi:Ca2+/H+ antiporter